MKKLLVPFMILVFLFSTLISASAETSKIEISFKVGSETAIVNGKTMKTSKIFSQNGIVMISSEIFTEGFGATVNYNSTDKSVAVNYNNTTVILYVDQKKGLINGQEVAITSGPMLKNSVIMLPAKFIAETFGADCSFDSKTQEIRIVKVIAGDKSIKDFSLILKKTVKSKVGDSFYKWSMNFPKGIKISDRSFDGTNTSFESIDGSYQIYINIFPKGNETIDTLMAEDLDNFSGFTLVSQVKAKKDNTEYSKTVFKNDASVWEVRNFLNDKWVVELSLNMSDYDKYINSTVNKDILDTFSLNYQTGSQVEDLSDITKEGFRKYEDKNLKFSVDVMPEWSKDEYSDKHNTVEFIDILNDSSDLNSQFCVNMFSYKAGFTLEQWVKNIELDFQDNVNSDYYKIVKVEDGVVNGVKCKKIYYTQSILGETIYSCRVLLLGKNYKYNVFYHVNSDTYNDPDKIALFEKALNSFRFSEPDAKKVGSLMDPFDIEKPKSNVVKKNIQYKWLMEIPAYFNPEEGNNDRDEAYYGSESVSVRLAVLNNVHLEGMIDYFDDQLDEWGKLGTHKEVDKTINNEKGTEVYKYTYLVESDKLLLRVNSYFLQKNGNLYSVDIICPVMYLSEKNSREMEEIWNSMKFE